MDTAIRYLSAGEIRGIELLPDERLSPRLSGLLPSAPAVPSLTQRATPVDAAAQAVASPWATWAEVLEMAGG